MNIGPLKEIRNMYPDVYQVTWIINNICNNACTYCMPGLFAGKNHGFEWENGKRFVEYILNTKKSSHWSISGGEPTMSPFFTELTKMIYDSGNTVGFTTNGVRSIRYFNEIAKYVNYISFSWHPEYPEENLMVEKLLTTNLYTQAAIRIMCPAPKELWDKSMKMIKRVRQNKHIAFESVKIIEYDMGNNEYTPKELFDYSEEQEAFFNSSDSKGFAIPGTYLNENKVQAKMGAYFHQVDDQIIDSDEVNAVSYINQGYADFRGWKCNTGIEACFIHHDGTIQTANCANDEKIGHINELEKIKWPQEPTLCRIKTCSCSTDVNLSKISPNTPRILI